MVGLLSVRPKSSVSSVLCGVLLLALAHGVGLWQGIAPAAAHGGDEHHTVKGPTPMPVATPAAERPGRKADSGFVLAMPMMNAERGMKLFAGKGCVACHAVKGVGGRIGPNMDTSTMDPVMNPFDFVAKMWAKAPVMIPAQEEKLGHQVELAGDELADIVAFTHDDAQQRKFTLADVPPEIRALMAPNQGEGATRTPREAATVHLAMPVPDSRRGMKLFAAKGCVLCHAVNDVGGDHAANLDAHTMPQVMNPFDFAAKMWTMAPAMIPAQEEELGHQVQFTGQELIDIVAFLHNDTAQHEFSESAIPVAVRKQMMQHDHGEQHSHDAAPHGHGAHAH